MTDDHQILAEIVADLMRMVDSWEKAADHAERAAAMAYRRAAADLRAYVTGELPNAQPEPVYQALSTAEVERVLAEAGIRPSRLFADRDHAFSAIFARLPAVPLEERLSKMETIPGLQVIESGTLMETREPFIDFGFVSSGTGSRS